MTPAAADAASPNPLTDLATLGQWNTNAKAAMNGVTAIDSFMAAHAPVVYMEAPTGNGNKYWQARINRDHTLELSWGPVGGKLGGAVFSENQCRSGLFASMYFRAAAKLKQNKGYFLVQSNCHFPIP